MTRRAATRVVLHARRWLVRRVTGTPEGGFVLLESLIAITVIAIVMSAVGVEFLGTTMAAGQQRAKQVAVQLANSTMDQVRSLDATQLRSGSSTADPLKVGTVSYSVEKDLDWCSMDAPSSAPTECRNVETQTAYLRATVYVRWTGQQCPKTSANQCAYETSALLSTTADPTFKINDAPVNKVPGQQETPRNTNKVFSAAKNNEISISDVDAFGAIVEVQLTATNGTLTLPVLTGLTFTVGDGTSDLTMTFRGTIATINQRLDGATFVPTPGYMGPDGALKIVTSDLGNSGPGGTQTDSDTVRIAVNDLGIFTAAQDIGGPSIAGSSAYSAGTYSMTGSGADIWGAPDQFQYLYRTMTGDGRLTARVVTDTPFPSNNAAKAGVMIRDTLTSGSVHALMNLTAANGTEFIARGVDSQLPSHANSTGNRNNPYWVRITRFGQTLKGESSPDGITWTQQGLTQTITMGATTYIGLVTMSHVNSELYSATFDNVALTTPPTAVAESYSTNEDTTLTVPAATGVLANDTDPQNNPLTATLVSGTSGLTLNPNGSFTYVPPADFSGTASFTYKANDGAFDSNTVTVNLIVNPANETPSFTKGANQSVARDSGAQSVAPWASAVSQGAGETGQLVNFIVTNDNNSLFSVQPAVSAAGTLTYTPSNTATGVATVSVQVHDNGGTANGGTDTSTVQTFTITTFRSNVAPVNGVPGAQQTSRNTSKVFSAANNNQVSISDVDAFGATVEVQLSATNGTVTLPVLTGLTFTVGDGTSDPTMTFRGTIATINLRLDGATFVPTTNYTGPNGALQIVTSDLGNSGAGGPLTDIDTVTVAVNSLGIFTAAQDIGGPGLAGTSSYTGGTAYTVAGSGNDIWGSGDQFQYLYRSLTGDGRLTAKVLAMAVTPTTNSTAKASVMFRQTTAAGSMHATMTMQKGNGSVYHYRTVTNGGSGQNTTSVGIVPPYWIRLTRIGDTFTPQRSVDGVTWTAEGSPQTLAMGSTIQVGLAASAVDNTKLNTATFDNVAITTPPTAVTESYATNEDTTLTVPAASGLLANDTDPENDALTAVLVSGTAGLTLSSDGSFTYVPPANFSGAASFTYKTNDRAFDSNTVTVNLTVNTANETPSFTKGADQSVARNAGPQTVTGWASGISPGVGESSQVVDFLVTNSNNTLFSVQPAVSAGGTLTYTPSNTAAGVVTVSVRVHDNGGTANGGLDTSAVQTFTITLTTIDTTGPTGGSVDASNLAAGRYATSTTLSLTLVKGADPSGVATSGNLLRRATATLVGGSCGAYGAYTTVTGGIDPTSPKSDVVPDQACYRYQYVVQDTLGNATTYTSPDIKVDRTAPAAPTLTHSAFTNTYWSSGGVVYYRSGAASGSFTTTATATDTTSGIASYTFPALGTNWTSTPGAAGVTTYSWSGVPAPPGTKSVTATNNAGVTSAGAPFTPTDDSTAPSAGTVTPPNASQTSTTVSVGYTTGTDVGSGIDTRLLQRQSAPLTSGTCGTYGGWTTASTNPVSSPFADTVTTGFCYKYQYVVSDRVGNTHTATSTNVVKVSSLTYFQTVSAEPGLLSYYRLDEALSSSPLNDSGPANNDGTYAGGPTMAQAGAVAGNNSVLFDGVNDTGTITRQIREDFSIEFWFKSTQGVGTGAQWYNGAGLVNADVSGPNNDFGVSLRSDGRVIAGTGNIDTSIMSSAGGYNNGVWHHVVFTRTGSTGTIKLYVDGGTPVTGTGSSQWLENPQYIYFGRTGNWGAFYAGSLDEVALYTTALSPATVTAHYGAR